jgi:peptidoglycan/xylan/chitin deacetylase (PgdA/CDA1 family)
MPRRGPDDRAVPVLMYHDLVEDPGQVPAAHRPYVVSAGRFREQMDTLRRAGAVGTRLDACFEAATPAPGAARRVVLTFDDGHESCHSRALPILLEAGFSATFFITVSWIGTPPYMGWKQLAALAASGMEIGSHSMTHRPPASLSRSELLAEMSDSKKILEDRLGRPILSASSPTGFFNPEIIPVVVEAGYRALCLGRIGLWRTPSDRYAIPRIPVKIQTTTAELRSIVEGRRSGIALLRGKQLLRDALKKALGIDLYLKLRRHLLRRSGRRS